ncbi:hypothetical protein N7490_008598 [Penicillium lividum]|nr:hypothetical protein N7490_008598 [Penicillium lividum]
MISKLRKSGDWDEGLETAGYDAYRNLPRLKDIWMKRDTATVRFKQAPGGYDVALSDRITGKKIFTSKCILDSGRRHKQKPIERQNASQVASARQAAIYRLVASLQSQNVKALEDIFDDLKDDLKDKNLERFYDLVDFGMFRLELSGSEDCIANVFLHNNKRVSEAQTQVMADRTMFRSQLERKAVAILVSKLIKTPYWNQPVHLAAKVPVTDELMMAMQDSRDELLQTERNFKTRKFPPSYQSLGKPDESDKSDQEECRSQALSKSLNERRQSEDASTIDIRFQQDQLPVIQIRHQVLELINQHTFSIIAAETGSGKSTQIPQIILDDATDQGVGGKCNVLCVQPRRIAAQFLAERVSHERGEHVGNTVGCIVRYDSRKSTKNGGSITYCTTGILLNMLQNRPEALSSLTHIVLDEVHVRDIQIDLTMLLLKRYVAKCRLTGAPTPRIVILSATIDLDLFSSYFANIGPDGSLVAAPYLSIPGRQYNVKKHNLDEVLDNLAATFEPELLSNLLHGPDTKKFLDKHYAHLDDENFTETSNSGAESTDLVPYPAQHSQMLEQEDRLIPYGLIAALVFHLLTTTTSGAILVFLPGIAAIDELHKRILEFTRVEGFDLDFSDEDRFRLLRLHSALPVEMAKLSQPYSEGCRRVFLATDVAEASVTIPDVKYVIDSGRVNNLIYDHTARSSRLGPCWASQSSAVQRAGRAGRVQDGEYFFIGTQQCYDSLRKTKSPTIQRAPLDDLCLRVKSTVPEVPILDVLKQAIEPPDTSAVLETIRHLKQIGAMDEKENLTDLGALLSQIPAHPSAGKLVILGIMFSCLDPMLILATSSKDGLFRWPLGSADGERIRKSRNEFAGQSHCDHIGTINAFKAIRDLERHKAREYAESNNIEFQRYEESYALAELVMSSLRDQGLVHRFGNPYHHPYGHMRLNKNSDCISLIKALILHAQYPHVAAPKPLTAQAYFTKTEKMDYLMPTSAAHILPAPLTRDLLTYQEKRASNPPMLIEGSLVSPLTMCLLGGRMVWKEQILRMDSWLRLGIKMKDPTYTTDEAARSIIELHKAIDMTLKAGYAALNNRSQEDFLYYYRRRLFKTLQNAVITTLQHDSYRFAEPNLKLSWNTSWDRHEIIPDETTSISDEEELNVQ